MRTPVDYDRIAHAYDTRYERSTYAGVEKALTRFVCTRPRSSLARSDSVLDGVAREGAEGSEGAEGHEGIEGYEGVAATDVLEVGCGTGHWLQYLHNTGCSVVGIDPSQRMLDRARGRPQAFRLIRAQAEALPIQENSFDRILCVNALHHFTNRPQFFQQARRLLRAGGAVLTIGLDPHTGHDEWWVYDYFPAALGADRLRYSSAADIRALMSDAGFVDCETREVHRFKGRLTAREAGERGLLARTSTSQLTVMSDAEYEAGLTRIQAEAEETPDRPFLRVNLRLYGTTGRMP